MNGNVEDYIQIEAFNIMSRRSISFDIIRNKLCNKIVISGRFLECCVSACYQYVTGCSRFLVCYVCCVTGCLRFLVCCVTRFLVRRFTRWIVCSATVKWTANWPYIEKF